MGSQLHISSELMTHYKQLNAVSAEKKMQAISTDAYKGFLSIGEDQALYLTFESSERASGWSRVQLCIELRKLYVGKDLKVKTFASAYDALNKRYVLIVAVTVDAKDYIYLSSGGSIENPQWREVKQKDTGVNNVHELHISVNGRECYIIVDFMQKNGTVERFYLNSNESIGNMWDYYPLSADFGEILDTHLGRAIGQRVNGFYTLGKLSRTNQLLYMPTYNPYDPGVSPTSVRLQVPEYMDTLAVLSVPGTKFTHLFAAGSGKLLLYPYDRQNDLSGPIVIANSDYLRDVKQLFAYTANGKTYVWALNGSKQLVYLHTQGASINAANEWSELLLARDDIGYAYIFCNAGTGLGAMFGYISDNSVVVGEESALTGIWNFSTVHLEAKTGAGKSTPSFITQLTLTDQDDLPIASGTLFIKASERCCAEANGRMYYFKETPLEIKTNSNGEVKLIQTAYTTNAIKWTITAEGLTECETDPSQHIVDKLLALDTPDKLKNAQLTKKAGSTEPLVPPGTDNASLEAVSQTLKTLKQAGQQVEAERGMRMLRGPIAMGTLEDFEPIVPQDGVMPGVRLSIRGGVLTSDVLRINDESVPDALLVTPFGVTMRAAPRAHLTANDVFSFLRTLANKAYDVFITVVDDAWRFIVKVGEKIVSFIIDCAEKIAECAKEIFNLIKVSVKKLIDYLKFIFDMEDVLKTRDVIKKTFNLQISYFLASMEHYKSKSEEFMDKLIRMAETWGDLTPLDQLAGGMGGGSHAKKFDVKAKHFCDTLSSNADKASHAAPHPATALDSYVNSIKGVSAEAMEVINTFVERIKADLLDGNAMMGMSFGAVLKKLVAILSVTVLDIGKRIISAIFDIVILTIKSVLQWINEPLYIPIVSEFLSFCGVGEFSLLDAVCFVPAFAGTVIYKIATGKPLVEDSLYNSFMNCDSIDDVFKLKNPPVTRALDNNSVDYSWSSYCAFKRMAGVCGILETLVSPVAYMGDEVVGEDDLPVQTILAVLSGGADFIAGLFYKPLDGKVKKIGPYHVVGLEISSLVTVAGGLRCLNAATKLTLFILKKPIGQARKDNIAFAVGGVLSSICLVLDIICTIDGAGLSGEKQSEKTIFYLEETTCIMGDINGILDAVMHFMGGKQVLSTTPGQVMLGSRVVIGLAAGGIKIGMAAKDDPLRLAETSASHTRMPGLGGLTPVMA